MKLLLMIFTLFTFTEPSPPLTCDFVDQWIGGEPFAYEVDSEGNWNFPPGTELFSQTFVGNAGIQTYYVPRPKGQIITDPALIPEPNNDLYVIVYLDLDATQPAGERLGQHNICVYRIGD